MRAQCPKCRGSGFATRTPRRIRCWNCKGVGYFPDGKRLTFPAPRRVCEGVSHAWTEQDVVAAKAAGAYFLPGRHDFADDAAEIAALGKKVKRGGDVRSFLAKLSPEQLEILRDILSKEAT